VRVLEEPVAVTLAPRESRAVALHVHVGDQPGDALITADVRSENMEFRDWVEAMITIE
jgi:hypothetical protein